MTCLLLRRAVYYGSAMFVQRLLDGGAVRRRHVRRVCLKRIIIA